MRFLRSWSIVVVLLLIIGWSPGGGVASAQAADFLVNGITELAQAIEDANDETTHPGRDVIYFMSRSIRATAAYASYNGPTALPQITSEIVIRSGRIQRDTPAPDFRLFAVAPGGHLILEKVKLQNGSGADGAAIFNEGQVTLRRSEIANNQASSGGVIHNQGTLLLDKSRTTTNHGGTDGIIYTGANATTTILNSLMTDDTEPAVYADTSSTVQITHSTLVDGSGGSGDMLFSASGSSLIVHNSILWSDDTTNVGISGTPTIEYSLVKGGYPGTGNVDAKPQFITGFYHNYYLHPGSPATNTGSNTRAVDAAGQPLTRDYMGHGRISGGTVDMGMSEKLDCAAYHAAGYAPYTIGTVSPVLENDLIQVVQCATFANASLTIDFAGQTVLLSDFLNFDDAENAGSYQTRENTLPFLRIDVTMQNGTLRRITDTTEFRMALVDSTGSLTLTDMTFENGSLREVIFDGGAILNAGTLDITRTIFRNNMAFGCGAVASFGNTTVRDSLVEGNTSVFAAGAFCVDGAIYITNTIFRDNHTEDGYVVIDLDGNVTIEDSVIEDNSSLGATVGVASAATVQINRSRIQNNTGINATGGIDSAGTLTVSNSVIQGNNTSESGSGISNSGNLTLLNSLITGNSTTANPGGAVYSRGSSESPASFLIVNSTISGNEAPNGVGGVVDNAPTASTDRVIINSIIAGNEGAPQITSVTGSVTASYSLIEGGFPGTGNLDADPLFVDSEPFSNAPTTAGDYRLQPTSPAIDSASNPEATAAGIGSTDLDGDARFVDVLGVPDSGEGSAPVIDMGAYEASVEPPDTDLNDDGIVSPVDVMYVINRLQSSDLSADLDFDGDVDADDVQIVLNALGD